ncbi:hypothetical protein FRC15_008769 [Serendipita sp. 397]|nr:hypothetical protein FRC15_008769 [Serendipita sp. 397]
MANDVGHFRRKTPRDPPPVNLTVYRFKVQGGWFVLTGAGTLFTPHPPYPTPNADADAQTSGRLRFSEVWDELTRSRFVINVTKCDTSHDL